MLIKEASDPEKEKQIDKLKDEFLEVQGIVSEMRKKGLDTRVVELILIDLPPKIKIAQITQDDNDIKIVKKTILDLRNDIDEINKGSDFEHLHSLLEEAFECARLGDKEKAAKKYGDLIALYKLLPKDLKNTVYSACIKLNEKLK
jgi:hypothetical protein